MGNLKIGSNYPPTIKLGSAIVNKIMLGSTQVWPNWTNVVVFNGGTTGTTDWLYPVNGLAQGWFKRSPISAYIGVGTYGFTGNYQGTKHAGTNQYIWLASPDLNIADAKSRMYKITFKYRCTIVTGTFKLYQLTNRVIVSASGDDPSTEGIFLVNIPSNTGNAISFEYTFTPTDDSFQGILFYARDGTFNNYLEIDQVTLERS